MTFAELFVNRLNPPRPFPSWIFGIVKASKNPIVNPVVDLGWQWAKSRMMRN